MHEVLCPVVRLGIKPEALDSGKVVPDARVQDGAHPFDVVARAELAQRFQDAAHERGVVVGVRGGLFPLVEAEEGVELEGDALPLCARTSPLISSLQPKGKQVRDGRSWRFAPAHLFVRLCVPELVS